jgi:CheY-like chemotaxis protein
MKSSSAIRILLADDDVDDCLLFEEALTEIPMHTSLSVANDGEQLLKRLLGVEELPEVLFLDLNMPRRNGFDCLQEIKKHDRTKDIPVIIISTSFDPDIVQLLFAKGARYYICKPARFENLRAVIHRGLVLISDEQQGKITSHHIVLNP